MNAIDAKSRAAARLAGMNLARVLDIDGSGLIDPIVLQRSLLQFDGSVFTEETIKELMLDVGEKARQGSRIVIRDFASLVSAPYPIACGASYLDCHVDGAISSNATPVLTSLASVEGFREVVAREALDRTARGSPKDLERLSVDLKQRARDYFLEVQSRSIGPIWDNVDRDKVGALSPEACQELVAAYLAALVPKSWDLARSAIELGVELSVIVCEHRMGLLADARIQERLRAQAKVQVDSLSAKIAPLVAEQMSRLAQGSPADVVAELLQTLELTADGKVTREVFEAHFMESMQHVLGPERMVERAHRVSTGPDMAAEMDQDALAITAANGRRASPVTM